MNYFKITIKSFFSTLREMVTDIIPPPDILGYALAILFLSITVLVTTASIVTKITTFIMLK